MTPADFIRKWSDSRLRERQGSQEHFIDLCRLLGQPTPAEDDPKGERYCFERGAAITGGGDGWADVWRRGCFGWEYKGKHKDLQAALRQLVTYALDLESPPYLVVSDMERIEIHSNWTNTVTKTWILGFDDLRGGTNLDLLRAVFEGSDRFKPGQTPQELTAKVAARFGKLGRDLQERGHHPRAVAHFLNRLVFCMFAEDAGLLPKKLFSRVIKATIKKPELAQAQLSDLFAKMAKGGFFGADAIKWFNGGLFDDDSALPLMRDDLDLVHTTADEHNWSQIDPAIFGNLFEQALKATRERPALGAHYTDRAKILKIVEPTIIRPLTKEWEQARTAIKAGMDEAAAAEAKRKAVLEQAADALKEKGSAAKEGEAARRKRVTALLKAKDVSLGKAKQALEDFLARLGAFRVLDPACGSGNFLYVALHALKDLELRALVEAERLGLPAPAPRVGLEAVKGIEIEAYAAELARVTLWIGDLQWMMKNGYSAYTEPVLSSLDQIECRDALLNPDGSEAQWPKADVIIGNPPFLGDRRMVSQLGEEYVEKLRATFENRIPGRSDFVCYWFAKSIDQLEAEQSTRCGLVATNSISGGNNLPTMDLVTAKSKIWEAWSDEPWVIEGAAVRVAIICFGTAPPGDYCLDGKTVTTISASLTENTSVAEQLAENQQKSFIGTQKNGPFDIEGEEARKWLAQPLNPNGRPNSDVVRPWTNGFGLVRRPEDRWIVDFGTNATEDAAAYYEMPFLHVVSNVKPTRVHLRREWHRTKWWLHGDPRPALRDSVKTFSRFIATPLVSKHRVIVWLPTMQIPENTVIAIARDDDTSFGVLQSRFHELWSLRLGTWLGVGNDPRYTPSTTFETFPFPEDLTPNIPAHQYADDPRAKAIAEAAAELNRRARRG